MTNTTEKETKMNIYDLTLGQIKDLQNLINAPQKTQTAHP